MRRRTAAEWRPSQGAPPTFDTVHPTQLYEVAWLLPVAAFLWMRRKRSPFVFGEYLVLNGLGRIVIEHWRLNDPLALGLTQPQWIGVALIVAGVTTWAFYARRDATVDAPPASVGKASSSARASRGR